MFGGRMGVRYYEISGYRSAGGQYQQTGVVMEEHQTHERQRRCVEACAVVGSESVGDGSYTKSAGASEEVNGAYRVQETR
jgi:hypothetical protein